MRLFDLYDINRDGELDYKEFAAAVYGTTTSGPKRPSPEKALSRKLSEQDSS